LRGKVPINGRSKDATSRFSRGKQEKTGKAKNEQQKSGTI